jgi:S-ribosylhomocysteine lyase
MTTTQTRKVKASAKKKVAKPAAKTNGKSNGKSEKIDPRLAANLGEVDHRIVLAPYIRLISCTDGKHGDKVWLWDFRFTQPNKVHIPMASVHSLEHMIAVFIRKHLPGVINFGCMGCQTGFYLSVLNFGDYDGMCDVVAKTFADCLAATEVPLANVEQCGWAENHSLTGAQEIIRNVLSHKARWQQVYA